ncbi:MAG: hypothetical protein ACOH2M_05315 [Cypionkella sp.]
MNWLTNFTNWLREQIVAVWTAVVDFAHDLLVGGVDAVLTLFAAMVAAIPVPDFLANLSICGILANAGPTAAWAMGAMHVPEGMAMVAGGVTFRLLRKVVTLFQW